MNNLLKSIVLALIAYVSLGAVVTQLSSEKKLDQLIEKRQFLVMVFYNSKINSKQVVAQLEAEVKQLAQMSLYQQGKVFFTMIDLAHQRFDVLKERYGVAKVPAVVFFLNGINVRTERGGSIILSGMFTKEQLDVRIKQYMGEPIEEKAAHERDVRNREKDAFWENYQNIYYGYPFDINLPYQRGPWYGYPYEGGPFVDFGV